MSTISSYVGDGVTKQFDITFTYTTTASVKARVDGAEVTGFTFVNASRVELPTAPASGTLVEIYRKTDVSTPVVTFADGAIIRDVDLNNAIGQPRTRAEEMGSEISALSGRVISAPGVEAGFKLPTVSARASKYLAFDANGKPTAMAGTADNPNLRSDLLASASGSAIVAFIAEGANASSRTVQAKLRELAVSILDYGAVGDWDGTTGTDNSPAIDKAIATGARWIFVPPGRYMHQSPIVLASGQQLVGAAGALYTASSSTNAQSLLAFRPTVGSKVAIKNAVNTNGQGVRGVSIDLNDATNYGIQFATTYGSVIEDVRFFGTFDIGILVHDNYVVDINRIDMTGCTIKRAGILVGTFNDINIRKFHSSTTVQDAATCSRGIALYGDGRKVTIDAVMQGWTIGLDVKQAQNVSAQLYNENVVCAVKLGDNASSARGVTLQGNFGGPYVGHPQYASRGPVVYLRGANAVRIRASRWESTPDPASGTGPWSILCGGAAGNIAVDVQDIFGTTIDRNLVMRSAAGDSPSIDMTSQYGSFAAREVLLKNDGAYGGAHFGLRVDSAGALTTSAWAPTVITGAPAALLTGEIPDPATILL